jgi:hypothetical protein
MHIACPVDERPKPVAIHITCPAHEFHIYAYDKEISQYALVNLKIPPGNYRFIAHEFHIYAYDKGISQHAPVNLKSLLGIIVSLSIPHHPHIYAPSPTQYSTSPCVFQMRRYEKGIMAQAVANQ